MPRTLVLSNDFPTRRGGIETFVLSLCQGLPPEDVVVYTARMPGGPEYDAGLPFDVRRDPTPILLPSLAVTRRVTRVLRETGCERVLVGSSVPLGLMAPALRRAGARRIVAMTHGHEVWWSRAPGTRQALYRVGEGCDVLTYVSRWCRDQIAPVLSVGAASRMTRLSPGVDPDRFRPGSGGAAVRARLGIPPDAPVVVCAARLVLRKGQDALIRAWPRVLAAVPDARLLLVGEGHNGRGLRILARGLGESVLFSGSVDWAEMPAYLDAGDVFAMPCRTRLAGWEPEAFGIVFLEAQAAGLPVLVGRSGGAPETVLDGETGYVLDPRSRTQIADRVIELLTDPDRSRAMGAAGRAWVRDRWTWADAGDRLARILDGDPAAETQLSSR